MTMNQLHNETDLRGPEEQGISGLSMKRTFPIPGKDRGLLGTENTMDLLQVHCHHSCVQLSIINNEFDIPYANEWGSYYKSNSNKMAALRRDMVQT